MANKKDSQLPSKPTSFRFKPEVLDVLKELVGNDIKCPKCGRVRRHFNSKTEIIEDSLAALVAFILRDEIAEQQIKEYRRNPRQIFRLYIMVCRAKRKEEGYGFTGRTKKKRFVYGPEHDGTGIYAHMMEEHK